MFKKIILITFFLFIVSNLFAITAGHGKDDYISGRLNVATSISINNKTIEPIVARPVIFDTDWCSDVDDVVDARMVVFGERIGVFNLLAVIASVDKPIIVPSIDAFFEFEGRANLAIGVNKDGANDDTLGAYQYNMLDNRHKYASSYTAEDSNVVYRRALATSSEKVDVIISGSFTAFYRLMLTPADSISPLTGAELVTQKVNHIWIMGGAYPSGSEWNFNHVANYRVAANYVTDNCTVPITFSGYEVGVDVITGDTLGTVLGADNDMLAKALLDHGSQAGRPSWGAMNILLAIREDIEKAGYFAYKGKVNVNASTGANTFTYDENGIHRYVVKKRPNAWYKREINTILERTSWSDKTTGGKQIAKVSRLSDSMIDRSNLICYINADDYIGTADGYSIWHMEDRTNSDNDFRAAAAAETPTFALNQAGVNGTHNALYFSGTKKLNTEIKRFQPSNTVYLKVKWNTLPTSNQTVICQDFGVPHLFHFKMMASKNLMSARFLANNNGVICQGVASALTANTWHIMTATFTDTQSKIYLDGTLIQTANFTAGTLNSGWNYFIIGGHMFSFTLEEGFVGYLQQARIYKGVHDQTTINSVISEINT